MRQRPTRVKIKQRKRWPGKLYLALGAAIAVGGALLAAAIYSWLGWMAFFTLMALRLMSDDAFRLWAIAIGIFSGSCSGVVAGFATWLGLRHIVAHPRRLFLRTWVVWTIFGAIFWLFERGLGSGTSLILGGGVAARAIAIASAAWIRHSRSS